MHHKDGLHLEGGVLDRVVWQRRWHRLAAKSVSWYTSPSVEVQFRFMKILAAEWQGVLDRSWNSKRPLVFAQVVLTNTLGVCRARYIRVRITRSKIFWERGLHAVLVESAEAEGAAREDRVARGGEEEGEAISQRYHSSVLLGKMRQAVCQATYR